MSVFSCCASLLNTIDEYKRNTYYIQNFPDIDFALLTEFEIVTMPNKTAEGISCLSKLSICSIICSRKRQ